MVLQKKMIINSPKLELYYFPSCPFCHFVQQKIEELNINVKLYNIHQDPKSLRKLVDDTGRSTVPCLYTDGKPMHESSDIIRWLDENKDKLEKK
jgi:glutaredoxin 3